MKFYPHHISDYRSATAYLSNEEDICYRRMLDLYYDTEQPLQDDPRLLSRLTKVSNSVVEDILKEFFILIDGKWHNSRADKEILDWYRRSDSARAKADKRWQVKRENAASIQSPCNGNATALPQVCCDDATQYPIPNTKSKPKVKTNVTLKRDDSVLQVFDHWKSSLGHDRAKLDQKRNEQIKSALALGYSVEDLCNAITGCSKSPFHMGDNANGQRYDSLALILRDAEKIDQFLGFYRNPPSKPQTQKEVSDSITNKALGLDKLAAAIKARQAFSNVLIEGEVL